MFWFRNTVIFMGACMHLHLQTTTVDQALHQTKARFKPIYSLHVLERPVEKIGNLWRL